MKKQSAWPLYLTLLLLCAGNLIQFLTIRDSKAANEKTVAGYQKRISFIEGAFEAYQNRVKATDKTNSQTLASQSQTLAKQAATIKAYERTTRSCIESLRGCTQTLAHRTHETNFVTIGRTSR